MLASPALDPRISEWSTVARATSTAASSASISTATLEPDRPATYRL